MPVTYSQMNQGKIQIYVHTYAYIYNDAHVSKHANIWRVSTNNKGAKCK